MQKKIFSEISHQRMVFILHFYVIGRSVLPLAVDRASYIGIPGFKNQKPEHFITFMCMGWWYKTKFVNSFTQPKIRLIC